MIIPVGFAQATFVFSGTNTPLGAVCTLGIDVQGFGGDGVEAAEALYLAWQNNILPAQSGVIRLARVEVKMGPTSTGPTFDAPGESVGGRAGAVLAPNTAFLIEKQTALGGRQGRGRMFVPGVVAADIGDSGPLTPTIYGILSGGVGDLFADLIAADLPPVLLHSNAVAPTPLVNFSVDPQVATQRRRLRK